MAIFYLDTSALVKRYRSERGTEVVARLVSLSASEDRFYFSFLSVIELTSGIMRLVKGNRLPENIANEILARFRQDVRDLYQVWPLDENIARSAVSVVKDHRLRSGDAIHLATALAVASLAPDVPFILVSADKELLEAGTSAGLTALDPEEPTALQQLMRIRIERR